MIVYISVLLYWMFTWLILKNIFSFKKEREFLFLIIAASSLIIIMSLRDISVGIDLKNYFYEFQNSLYFWNNKIRGHEIGYTLINLLFKQLNLSFQAFLTFVSIFIVSTIALIYRLYSKNIFLSFYLYVSIGLFQMSMSGLRQMIAICITIIAFVLLLRKKRILFILLIILATYFHMSAIVFLPVLLFEKFKLTRKKAIILYFSLLTISLLIVSSDFFIDLFYNLILSTPYSLYISPTASQTDIKVAVENLMIPFFSLVYWPKVKNYPSQNYLDSFSIFFLLSCVSFSLTILAYKIRLLERIGFYFIFYNTLLIPNTLENIRDAKTKKLLIIIIILLAFVQLLMTFPDSFANIVPYKLTDFSYWNFKWFIKKFFEVKSSKVLLRITFIAFGSLNLPYFSLLVVLVKNLFIFTILERSFLKKILKTNITVDWWISC